MSNYPPPPTSLLSLTLIEGQNGTKMLPLPVSSELLLGCPERSPWLLLASGFKWKQTLLDLKYAGF